MADGAKSEPPLTAKGDTLTIELPRGGLHFGPGFALRALAVLGVSAGAYLLLAPLAVDAWPLLRKSPNAEAIKYGLLAGAAGLSFLLACAGLYSRRDPLAMLLSSPFYSVTFHVTLRDLSIVQRWLLRRRTRTLRRDQVTDLIVDPDAIHFVIHACRVTTVCRLRTAERKALQSWARAGKPSA